MHDLAGIRRLNDAAVARSRTDKPINLVEYAGLNVVKVHGFDNQAEAGAKADLILAQAGGRVAYLPPLPQA